MKHLVECSRLAACRSQPGGLPEISRGLRRTAKRSDDTPGRRAVIPDPERVTEALAPLQGANFFAMPTGGVASVGRLTPG